MRFNYRLYWLIACFFASHSLFSNPIFDAIKAKDIQKLQQETSTSAIDYQDKKGTTALMLCAKVGFFKGTMHLLGQNVDLNLRDHKGRTALHHAIRNNHTNIAQTLMNHRASPWDLDNKGRSASSFLPYFSSGKKIKLSIAQNVLIENLQLELKRLIADNDNFEPSQSNHAKYAENICISCEDTIDDSILNLCTACKCIFKSYIHDESDNILICFPQFPAIPLTIEALEELGLTANEIEFYRMNQTRIQLKQFDNIVSCPNKECQNLLTLKKDKLLKCISCNYVGCSCGILHSPDMSCEEGKSLLLKGFRSCPGCGILCKKVMGCDLITCPNCQEHWRYASNKRETKRFVGRHTFPDYALPDRWRDYTLMEGSFEVRR